MRLKELADRLECELKGAEEVEIRAAAGIDEAGPDEITFVSNPKYLRSVSSTQAGAIILSPDAPPASIPTLISDNPYLAFAKAIELFYEPPQSIPGIHPTASVSQDARIGENHSIGANAVITEGVRLGKNALIHPNVTIYPHALIGDDFTAHSNSVIREHCRIGDRVVLQNGAIVGADGFGFAPRNAGGFHKIVQSGIVILEDDVEMGANSCVDRATVGETRIGQGTKIDNLVQVGHGSRVGRHSILAGQVGLAGSTQVGDHVTLAGQVGTAGHISIGDRVVATAQTGIARSVEAGRTVSGAPEMDTTLWKRVYVLLQRLPDLFTAVKDLQKELQSLKGKPPEK